MKLLLALLFSTLIISSWTHTPEQRRKMEKLAKPCREELNLSQETISKVEKSGVIDDPKVSEFLACVGKKLGSVTEDGELNPSFYLNRAKLVAANEEEAKEAVEKCVVKKNNIGQSIYDAVKCLHQHFPNISALD